ncbi:MAG: sodium-independent anion transporter, partial [Clostridia bacterium]|nr:sodium-independent anion transporter [Clostridia bacterium]
DEKEQLGDEGAKAIPPHTVIYDYYGPMFFAGSDKLLEVSPDEDTRTVILRMGSVESIDATAMRTLDKLHDDLKARGVRLILTRIRNQPLSVMKKAGFIEKIGAENIVPGIEDALKAATEE